MSSNRGLQRSGVVLLAILLACFTGCGGGGGGGDKLTTGVGVVVSRYLVLDLASGQATPRQDIPDLATNPAYRSTLMVFRLLDGGSATLGSAASDAWGQSDEPQVNVNVAAFHCAVFDTTQAQWQMLAGVGSQPWLAVHLTALTGAAAGPDLPAYGMTYDNVNTVLTAAATRLNCVLALPSPQQWEYACRAGSSARFSWGAAQDDATVQANAVVQQPYGSVRGPQSVGSRLPNAFGLYDMLGNIWQWTNDGWLRGGSWRDGLPMARCANRIFVDPQTPHGLAGVRIVYQQRH